MPRDNNKIEFVETHLLRPSKMIIRRQDDYRLGVLRKSIRENGFNPLKPLSVMRASRESPYYNVVSGKRRLRTVIDLNLVGYGIRELPIIVKTRLECLLDCYDTDSSTMQYSEAELVRLILLLLDYGMTPQECMRNLNIGIDRFLTVLQLSKHPKLVEFRRNNTGASDLFKRDKVTKALKADIKAMMFCLDFDYVDKKVTRLEKKLKLRLGEAPKNQFTQKGKLVESYFYYKGVRDTIKKIKKIMLQRETA